MTPTEQRRARCWDYAVHCFGTATIFEDRARKLRRRLRWIALLGIAGPVLVGGLIVSFGKDLEKAIPILLIAAGAIGFVQLVLSALSLVWGWDDAFAHAQESMTGNYSLSNRYKTLAESPPRTSDEFEVKASLLDTEREQRETSDYRAGVTEKEKRRGMRAALRTFQRACIGCHEVPQDLKPTQCGVCGNF